LTEADLIAAEDTRKTRKLLHRYDIGTPLTSLHDHNKEQKTPQILKKLHGGLSVAVVSDAGTPSVSDPGFYLVRQCVQENLPVVPVPGVSAAIAALSVSGLPSDDFVFLGFLSRKKNKRLTILESLKTERRTLVIYESPKRLLALLKEISRTLGNRKAVLAREMTKIHEEFLRIPIDQIITEISARDRIKGECTLLVSGCRESLKVDRKELRKILLHLRTKERRSVAEIAKEVAAMYGLPKRQVYDEVLKMEKKK
jgi:16S rRNA (cytidine1402-2'-O)-methyltransferase